MLLIFESTRTLVTSPFGLLERCRRRREHKRRCNEGQTQPFQVTWRCVREDGESQYCDLDELLGSKRTIPQPWAKGFRFLQSSPATRPLRRHICTPNRKCDHNTREG